MSEISIYSIPKDIINNILTFVDNKTFYNCLKSSKLFNVKDYNLICKNNYLYHKYILRNIPIVNLILSDNLEGVKFLLENGINPNTKGIFNTILDYACRENSYEIVKVLLEYGADPNLQTYEGWTALMYVVHNFRGNISVKIIEELLKYGADKNLKNERGLTVIDMDNQYLKKDEIEIIEKLFNTK